MDETGQPRGRTGAERYFAELRENPDYEDAYQTARRRNGQHDAAIRGLGQRRAELGMTSTELGRLADLGADTVDRILTGETPDPALSTLIGVADALGLTVTLQPR